MHLSHEVLAWFAGDAHVHSLASTRSQWAGADRDAEGIFSMEELQAFAERLGLTFLAFTEHASDPACPERLAEADTISLMLSTSPEFVERLNRHAQSPVTLFSGVEASIVRGEDGLYALDVPDSVLSRLDVVIASRHFIDSRWEKSPEEVYDSLSFAAEHPLVRIIGHPDRHLMALHDWKAVCVADRTARRFDEETERFKRHPRRYAAALEHRYELIRQVVGREPITTEGQDGEKVRRWHETYVQLRAEYLELWDAIFDVMRSNRTAFEINLTSQPSLDVVERAAAAGVLLSIGSDWHDAAQYRVANEHAPYRPAYAAKKRWALGTSHDGDEELLATYRLDTLSSPAGYAPRLETWIARLAEMGVTPDRVVNSSLERFVRFLTDA